MFNMTSIHQNEVYNLFQENQDFVNLAAMLKSKRKQEKRTDNQKILSQVKSC